MQRKTIGEGETADMVTYERAYRIAKRLKPNIDHCTERTDAYLFGSHVDDFTIGGDGPVVIWNANGKAFNMTHYFSISRGAEEIRAFDLNGEAAEVEQGQTREGAAW